MEQEAARDLVRAREDVRGDLMRARHRLSQAAAAAGHRLFRRAGRGPARHDLWLRAQRFDQPGRQLAFESGLRDDAAHRAAAGPARRRDHRDGRGTASTPTVVRRLGCLRGISTLTGFGLAVEIGDWHRFTGSTIGPSSVWCPPSTPPASPGRRGRSPRPGTATPAGCWSRPPGTTARPTATPGQVMRGRWEQAPAGGPGPRPRRQPAAAPALAELHRPPEEAGDRQRRRRPRARRLVLVAGRPRVADHPRASLAVTDLGRSARDDPRPDYEQPTS